MSDLVRETIVVILVLIVVCKGSQRNALSPYSKSGNVFTDENTRIAMREDASNPLFAKGHFRKNPKKNTYIKMSKLKGFYFCQIMSLVQSMVIFMNLLNGFYIRYINVNGILGVNEEARMRIYIIGAVWVCINICVNLAFLAYYTRILDKTRKKNLRKLCRKDMIIAGEKQDNGYEMLDYPGEVSYREWIYKVENCFRNQFRGSSWECWGNAGESKENIHMLIEEDREQTKTRIFVRMQVDILNDSYIEQMNKFLYKKIRSALSKGELPLESPCLTCMICVRKRSEIFENIFCSPVETGREDVFPIGIVLEEHKIYVPKMKNDVQDMRYQEMKAGFLEILKFASISIDIDK